MESFYAWCALIGGAIFLIQMATLIIGFDGFDADIDFDSHPGDLPSRDGWFVGIVTFRSLVAALTVFGLIGLATPPQFDAMNSLAIASLAGFATLYAVGWSFKKMHEIRSDGTVNVQDTLGLAGTVYLGIPGQETGQGKVTLKVGGRTMEYAAMTRGEPLKTGTAIVVTGILSPQTLEVVSAAEVPARSASLAEALE